jgi:hypothetical protein
MVEKMNNEIIKKDSGVPAPIFSAHAEGDGIAVGYADTFSPTINLFLPDGSKTAANPDYFNLIIGYDPFPSDHILVDPKRALTEYISDDVKERFAGWTPEKIAEIKKLPAIISCERDGTDEQQAVFAFIRDIKVQDNGIKVYFQRYFPIPFSFLSENLSDLAMYLFELTRTHWTIKKIDLLEVMQDAGVFPGR